MNVASLGGSEITLDAKYLRSLLQTTVLKGSQKVPNDLTLEDLARRLETIGAVVR